MKTCNVCGREKADYLFTVEGECDVCRETRLGEELDRKVAAERDRKRDGGRSSRK